MSSATATAPLEPRQGSWVCIGVGTMLSGRWKQPAMNPDGGSGKSAAPIVEHGLCKIRYSVKRAAIGGFKEPKIPRPAQTVNRESGMKAAA